ncbi:MAG: glutamate--tRNA ligase [Gammaproteobacteria bacterium]|nr:glutamate--tRNA ligase [Gammaproteobacteria bacterium]MDE2251607.1 glutamate--tRNA ligase [Gammaproteobacteria bacterium]
MSVVTRFAPSPTGLLHIGGVRTALFSWLYARHHGGRFILRVEDTDRERSTDAAVRVILEGMQWLGLDADEGPYFQTRRFDRYREVLAGLLAAGHAYRCYCSKAELEAMREQQLAAKQKPRYDGRCRGLGEPRPGVDPVIRFRNPLQGEVVVDDQVHGRVVFQNSELDDLIIERSDGTPTYNFCVVVDDMDMGITHVIRGDDHLNNTPRQMNMLRALGAPLPVYAHVPMILGADGAKLSKRHGAVSVLQYQEEGYLPDALLNYLVRLGWSHGDQEVFSRAEMIAAFDVKDVNKAASAFNGEKLQWLNQQHMMRAPTRELAAALRTSLARLGVATDDQALLEGVANAQRERAKTLKEMAQQSLFFFRDFDQYDAKAARKHLTGATLPALEAVSAGLESLAEWNAGAIHTVLDAVATRSGAGLGSVAQPLRVAVCGTAVSPPIDLTVALIGRERTLARMKRAIAIAAATPS